MLEFKPLELTIETREELRLMVRHAKRLRRLLYFEITINPVVAAALLEINHPLNRTANQPDIDKQVRDLENRRWDFNGESVKVDYAGYLIDGQKRCMACIASGKSFKTLIVFNSDRTNINSSQAATAGSHVNHDLPHRNMIAAVVKYLDMEAQGRSIFLTGYKASASEIRAATEGLTPEHRVCELARLIHRLSADGMASNSAYIWLATHLDDYSEPGLVDDFFEQLASGEGIEKRSPVGMLRRRLRRDKRRERGESSAANLDVAGRTYLIARTFVAWYTGEDLRNLTLPKGKVTMQVILDLLKD